MAAFGAQRCLVMVTAEFERKDMSGNAQLPRHAGIIVLTRDDLLLLYEQKARCRNHVMYRSCYDTLHSLSIIIISNCNGSPST